MEMANNLDEMIKRSGLAKKQVAALTNNTPETVSRHVHGRTSMRQEDVELYAKVLECKPHEISYTNPPIPIIGVWRVCPHTGNLKCATRFSVYPQYWKRAVCLPGTYDNDYAAILWHLDEGYRGEWAIYNDCITLVKLSSIAAGVIDRKAIMKPCYVMTKAGVLIAGALWPQHENENYTVTNVVGVPDHNRILKNVEVAWAAHVVQIKFQCSTEQGMTIIDHESPFIKLYYDKMMMPQTQHRLDEFARIYEVQTEGVTSPAGEPHIAEQRLKQVQ